MADKEGLKITWSPDYYQWVPDGHLYTNRDVEYIAIALNAELRVLTERIEEWRLNINPRDCDTPGIREFEDWLEIPGSNAMLLRERIDAVIAQLNKTLPYTWIRLHKMMAAIVGWGNFTLDRLRARITVEIDQSRYSSWPAVWDLLEEVVPMNLYWVLVDKATAEPGEVKAVPGARVNMTVDSPFPVFGVRAHEHLGVMDYMAVRLRETTGEGFRETEPHYTDEGLHTACGSAIFVRHTIGEPF